jgi:hypothetical protein
MFEFQNELSNEGHRRREAILRLAQKQARRRRRGRLALKLTGTIAVLLTAISVVMQLHRKQPAAPTLAVNHPATPPRPTPLVTIEQIATDPALSSKLAIQIQQPRWQRLNDDQLLTTLADAGRPAGIIEVDGRAMLVPRDASSVH